MGIEAQEKVEFEDMSYPDFLGYFGVDNTPPGGDFTLNFWIKESGISAESNLLDMACSTGFSGRNIVKKTDCHGKGIDISARSVDAANQLARSGNISGNIQFSVGNAENLSFNDNYFTHITAGCCFGFIADKRAAIRESHRVLKKGGYLCVSPFFYEIEPDGEFLDLIEEYIGYRPDAGRDYEYWRSFFSAYFIIEKEEVFDLPVYTDEEIEKIVNISLAEKKAFRALSQEDKQRVYDRYYNTRLVLNEHAKFQSVALWVLRVNK